MLDGFAMSPVPTLSTAIGAIPTSQPSKRRVQSNFISTHLYRHQEDSMKRVTLDYGQATTISDEAFEQISAIVKANKVCERCGKPYTPERPNVELNRCLTCFLAFHHNQSYTYI